MCYDTWRLARAIELSATTSTTAAPPATSISASAATSSSATTAGTLEREKKKQSQSAWGKNKRWKIGRARLIALARRIPRRYGRSVVIL